MLKNCNFAANTEMQILTPRLLLRPYEIKDLEAVNAFQSDAEALKYEPWGPNTLEATRQMLELCNAAKGVPRPWVIEFAVTRLLDGQVVGGCIIELPPPSWKGWATIGYVIQRKYWGLGYATEATEGLIEMAKDRKEVQGVKAISDHQNLGSQRVLEKCGFLCVGMNAETEAVKGRFRDMLKYELAF